MNFKLALTYTAMIALFGCSQLTVRRSDPGSTGAEPPPTTRVIAQDTLLFGFIPLSKIYESDVCPKSRIETATLRMSGGDVGLALVTLGIYFPQKIAVTCAKIVAGDAH